MKFSGVSLSFLLFFLRRRNSRFPLLGVRIPRVLYPPSEGFYATDSETVYGVSFVLFIFDTMPKLKVSAFGRTDQFLIEGFYATESQTMFCKYSNRKIGHERKDTATKHVGSDSHLEKKSKFLAKQKQAQAKQVVVLDGGEGSSKQTSIKTIVSAQTRRQATTDAFAGDVVKLFLQTNVPLEKLESPIWRDFFNKYIEGKSIPCYFSSFSIHYSSKSY